jgi:hypothetical protein
MHVSSNANRVGRVMFSEDNRLATGIGLIVFALVGVAIALMRGPLAGIALSDTRVLAAVIGGCFALIGIVLSTAMTLLVGWWKDRKERTTVASALLSELYAQADLVVMCGSISNDHAARKQPMFVGRLEPYLPPTAVLFASLASKLPLLPPKAVSGLVAFHGAVEKGARLLSLLEKPLPPSMADMQNNLNMTRLNATNLHATPIIAKGWQSAAYLAVSAIKSLREFSSDASGGPEAEKIDKLMEELAEIALKAGTPRILERAQPPKSSSLAFVDV